MTLACAFMVSEGVVFGADSTTTVAIGADVVQLLNHAQKVFEVGRAGRGRMAICTWGAGRAGLTSHRTIAARLGDAVGRKTTPREAADVLARLVVEASAPVVNTGQPPGVLGYFLGGSTSDREPFCFQLTFDKGQLTTVDSLIVGEARFEGAPQLFKRAYRGFDPDLPVSLHAALEKRLVPQLVPSDDFQKLFVEAFIEAAATLAPSGHRDMPIREAIDFCHMYLHLTIKGFKFRFGPPVVGGPVELAFVSTDRQFRWVRHKPFDSAIEEQDGGLE